MPQKQDDYTHIVWAQYYDRGKFVEWTQTGKGYTIVDADGAERTYTIENRNVKGDNGRRLILRKGEAPPDPPPQRPGPGPEKTPDDADAEFLSYIRR